MSQTTQSFTDPVFLARFGLNCINVIEYFLHPLNPFRSNDPNICNEVLASQGLSIGELIHYGTRGRNANNKNTLKDNCPSPMKVNQALEEYHIALEKLTGVQYELVMFNNKNSDNSTNELDTNIIYTIRHINRLCKNSTQLLGIYYIIEGVIYKSPTVRSLLKAQLARTIIGLEDTCAALSQCCIYDPLLGYKFYNYEPNKKNDCSEFQFLKKSRKRRKVRRFQSDLIDRDVENEDSQRSFDTIGVILKNLRKRIGYSTSYSSN